MPTPRRLRWAAVARRHARSASSTVVELVGAGSITTGVVLIHLPSGLIVGGVLAIGIGWLLGAEPPGGDRR